MAPAAGSLGENAKKTIKNAQRIIKTHKCLTGNVVERLKTIYRDGGSTVNKGLFGARIVRAEKLFALPDPKNLHCLLPPGLSNAPQAKFHLSSLTYSSHSIQGHKTGPYSHILHIAKRLNSTHLKRTDVSYVS